MYMMEIINNLFGTNLRDDNPVHYILLGLYVAGLSFIAHSTINILEKVF